MNRSGVYVYAWITRGTGRLFSEKLRGNVSPPVPTFPFDSRQENGSVLRIRTFCSAGSGGVNAASRFPSETSTLGGSFALCDNLTFSGPTSPFDSRRVTDGGTTRRFTPAASESE